MTTDLHLLPLHRRAGEDLTDPLPGFSLAPPPRKAARSRQADQLLLHLTFTGTATLNANIQAQLHKQLAETYYQTSGAATTALRAMVESLNTFLLNRNLRAEGKGLQAIGVLTALVYRNEQLILAQSGPSHVFTIAQTGSQHLHDPQTSGHGLGLGRTAGLFVNVLAATPGALFLLSPAPPSAWDSPALQTAYGRPLRTVQRGLLKPAGPDLEALLIQVQEGTGKILIHKTPPPVQNPPPVVSQPPVESLLPEQPQPETAPFPETSQAPPESAPPPEESTPEPEEVAVALAAPQPQPESAPVAQFTVHSAPTPAQDLPAAQPSPQPPPRPSRPPRPSPFANLRKQIGPALLAVGRAIGGALQSLGYTLRSALTRILPGSELFTIPSATMAFIAIAIPILLVTIAFFVYQQRGRLNQFQIYLQAAQAAQTEAQAKETPPEQRADWERTLTYLNQAEQYQVTEETTSIRLQAQGVLDQLDNVSRLQFQPVLADPLAANVVIHRIAATAENVYMLNQTGGNVVRAWRSGRGYETDKSFRCGPLPNEALIVGPLIDIAPLPLTNYLGANLLGMDANGILVYCTHDDPPKAIPLPPPDSNWGNPVAFALDDDILYVLDPQTNAVWVYYGDNYEFRQRPRLFFDADVPPMSDVIDLTVDRGELYLLHADGHLTVCTFGFDLQPTRCTDPSPYTDPRPGMESGVTLAGANFSQIAFTPPPDPSIYLLDSLSQAIYHFSLRLTLQRQYRPYVIDGPPVSSEATAFAFSPSRSVFLAFGNQVWVASLP